MRDYNLRLILRITVILSYVLLVIYILTAPRFGSAQADPYFQLKNMPPIYWVGVLTSVAALLMSVFFWRKDAHHAICLGLLALLALTIYTNSAPRLMYENPIWMDTYTFVGETLDIVKSGHIGWGEAADVPGISLLASQISLITGLDYTVIAGFIPSLFSVIMVLTLYAVAQLFISKRGAVLAGFVYIGLYYIGFYFNRRCFSMPLQLLVWYALARFILGKRERSWFVVMVVAFAALVLAHPATSFLVVINTFAPVFLYLFIRLIMLLRVVRKDYAPKLQKISTVVSVSTSLLFLVMWLFWYAFHPGKRDALQGIIHQTIIALNSFSSSPSPSSGLAVNISGYTQGYYPIVALRFFDILFVSFFGIVLALLYVFSKKFNLKAMVLASWFISDISLSAYVLYSFRTAWSDMPFRYSLPAFAIIISWFIIQYRPRKPVIHILAKLTRVASLGIILLYVLALPLTMYGHVAFVYPPTENLKFNDHLTMYGTDLVSVIGGHMELEYFRFVNEEYDPPITLCIYGTNFEADALKSYDLVAWNFRAYVKDAFHDYDPPLTQSLANLENGLTTLHFAKIYDSPRHGIYARLFDVESDE
ncbi:hypothetical protein D4R86_03135 [bacterium]|nr:MAG: hypothetical protein D4R86_03135 [bacterium]